MIKHPGGKEQELGAAAFARVYLEQALWHVGETWERHVPEAVLAAMTPEQRREVGAEIFHLIRMIGLSCGLNHPEAELMWEGGPDEYRLQARYCHPHSVVRLRRLGGQTPEPGKYAIELANTDTGEFIQSLSNLGRQAAMEAGAAMAYSEHWLRKIGIDKDHGAG